MVRNESEDDPGFEEKPAGVEVGIDESSVAKAGKQAAVDAVVTFGLYPVVGRGLAAGVVNVAAAGQRHRQTTRERQAHGHVWPVPFAKHGRKIGEPCVDRGPGIEDLTNAQRTGGGYDVIPLAAAEAYTKIS